MSWVAAVKEFNASREGWVLPRKGTPEYDEVKKIQDRMKESAPPKPAKAPAAEGAQKPPRRQLKASDEPERPKRAPAKPKAEKPPTEPSKPETSKTRIASKPAGDKRPEKNVMIMDKSEHNKLKAPAIPVKPSGEPLKAKSKEERAADRESKKQTKLQIIETRSELAKAKLEKNKEAVVGLSQKIKDLKISLL